MTRTPARKSGEQQARAAMRGRALSQAAGLRADAAAELILKSLEDDKAEDIVSIDIKGRSSLADTLIVASGRSQRHVGALADRLLKKLKEAGAAHLAVEGLAQCDWVLVDAGDVIVHLFRPEVRAFYNIEKIWTPMEPARVAHA
jgi:ribosome-associated protein